MSVWQRITDLVTGRTRAQRAGNEPDVDPDPAQTGARPTGGKDAPDAPDAHSTTGPSANDTFVGRVAGEDATDTGMTGAEARAEAADRPGEPPASP
ncbi:MAG TPA: hypothetical protein VHZ97_21335 [Pseudonocardiaceae bacterium]|jgi:hypothetical protein|nr:hypothetical protein [Pseudonocardiaceae bacterium]